MSYWNDVKDVFMKGVDLAVDGIKEGASTIFDKGKEGIHYSQLRKDLFTGHRKLHVLLTEIGDIVTVLYRERKDLYADKELKEKMKQVTQIEDECRKIEKEISSLGFARKAG
ncbi:MAG TPA: hypothetical protein PK926_02215 [Spirochaetota bacterium]|nr:hypothetical protein [Spirochaetota bacterium]HPI88934.1 hypothetical protein [Spirochaetota bacterium]HPR46589.1 hypothetical protein [Spirochaetota bacterium]